MDNLIFNEEEFTAKAMDTSKNLINEIQTEMINLDLSYYVSNEILEDIESFLKDKLNEIRSMAKPMTELESKTNGLKQAIQHVIDGYAFHVGTDAALTYINNLNDKCDKQIELFNHM